MASSPSHGPLSSRCCQPADDQRHSCRCVLLVLYPLIDAVATLIDARSQHGSARQWLLVNAGNSTVAAIARGVAATSGVPAVFAVFGVWAAVSGAAQLIVVLLRRAQLGNQWPLLLANGVSVIGGLAFLIAAASAIRGWACSRSTRPPAAWNSSSRPAYSLDAVAAWPTPHPS